MTMEGALFNLLKPFFVSAGPPVSYRVFPLTAPMSTVRPYAIYQQLGGQVINPMDNSAPGLRNARMVIKVWADAALQAIALADQIEDAMRASTAFKARPEAARFNDYDEDLRLYGTEQEYSVWY